MNLFKRRVKPDYQHIAELERDLGIDNETVMAKRTKKRALPKAVILSPRSAPLDPLLQPRFSWPVNGHDDVRIFSPVSATACYSPHVYAMQPSRVVLPAGVRA